MYYTAYKLFRLCLLPFFSFVLPALSKKARQRLAFEAKNGQDPGSQSFYLKNKSAFFCFHFSSEGEFEQVRPLIYELITQKKNVELLFTSESVEHQCKKLFESYPEHIRYYRINVLSYNPFKKSSTFENFITAKKISLCRYDFFPELIFFAKSQAIDEFILFWARAKHISEYDKLNLRHRYLKWCYESFTKIVCSTVKDYNILENKVLIPKECLEIFDFRVVQILKRLECKEKTLKSTFNDYDSLVNLLNRFPKSKRVIYGSFWQDELDMFRSYSEKLLKDDFLHVIVAHQLKESNYIYEQLLDYFGKEKVVLLDEKNLDIYNKQNFIVLNVRGVLCELYHFFSYAYVGGGFKKSVHSLLEPFLSGGLVLCGPNVDRSSEYDLISENSMYDLIKLSGPSEIKDILVDDLIHLEKKEKSTSKVSKVKQHYIGHYEANLKWVGIK